MAKQHVAARIEDSLFRRLDSRLRGQGWRSRIATYSGYGGSDFVRLLARVLLTSESVADPCDDGIEQERGESLVSRATQRGWRAFLDVPAAGVPVQVTVGDRVIETLTDRSGYIDITVRRPGLETGWREVVYTTEGAKPATGRVLVVGDEVRHAIISDIDDTVMVTHMPRALIAAWNAFVRTEQARDVVPGMAFMYRELIKDYGPETPTFYLSTGAWNAAPAINSFLARHGYPEGPLLLTDWGPTNTGWFRSGWDHKITTLRRLAAQFPNVSWTLVGDDGQHDPAIYSEFVHGHPGAANAIAIRTLTATQQVLSHGLPISNDELLGNVYRHEVPMVEAPDGFRLLRRTQQATASQPQE